MIFGGNYGEAGAAEFYGARYGLPPVVSTTGSYWFFGPGTRPGAVLIAMKIDSTDLATLYRDVRPAGVIRSPWSVDEEREIVLTVGRGPTHTLQELWPRWAGQN